MDLAYMCVDASLRSGMCAPSGRRVPRGNLRSGSEYLTISSVSKSDKRICRVSRLIPAAIERPQHEPDNRPSSKR